MCSLYGHDGISGIGVGSNSSFGGMNVTYTVKGMGGHAKVVETLKAKHKGL